MSIQRHLQVAVILEILHGPVIYSPVCRHLPWSAPGSVLWARLLEITFKTSTSISQYAVKVVIGRRARSLGQSILFLFSESKIIIITKHGIRPREFFLLGGGVLIPKGLWYQMHSISWQKGMSQPEQLE